MRTLVLFSSLCDITLIDVFNYTTSHSFYLSFAFPHSLVLQQRTSAGDRMTIMSSFNSPQLLEVSADTKIHSLHQVYNQVLYVG
jgi:hypothetical protein